MSATIVARAGKRGNICVGNNVSATMCPRLLGPLVVAGHCNQARFCATYSYAGVIGKQCQVLRFICHVL